MTIISRSRPKRKQDFSRSEEISDSTPKIDDTLSRLSSKGIAIPHPSELRNYLFRHVDMLKLLIRASDLAFSRFGARAHLSLEVYQDPEINDEYLTMYVRLQKYDSTVMKQIKEIRKEYADLLKDASGWFLLTTDLKAPNSRHGI